MKINPILNTKFKMNKPLFSQIHFEKVFDVRNLENLYCPICGSMMFTKEQSKQFCEDLSCATGVELVKAIYKYEDLNKNDTMSDLPVFNSRQQEILDRIKITALEHKKYTLAEIADILGYEAREKYPSFSTSNITSGYTTLHPSAQPILSDEDYADVFFFKCHNREYTSYQVAHEFIKNKYPTIEHLVPASESGKNELSNYLCDCNECNAKRGSMPFSVWMNQIPNFEHNLQIQLDQINRALFDSVLDSRYSDYPDILAQTISTLSEGKINLLA